jgi:hypothetical protein
MNLQDQDEWFVSAHHRSGYSTERRMIEPQEQTHCSTSKSEESRELGDMGAQKPKVTKSKYSQQRETV